MDNNKTHIEKLNQNDTWYIIDAKNQTLGRFSSNIACILRGKNQSNYLPYDKNKTYIIIINSKLIKVTGNKKNQKLYKRHSGRPGGLKQETFNQLQQRIPNRILELSIKGMLPKNSLGRKLFTQLKIYHDDKHPYISQDPMPLTLNNTY